MEIKLGDTNSEKILRFLDLTRDYNPIHREKRITPGMFYLALVSRYFSRPLKSMSIGFKGIIEYPFECDLNYEEENNRARFQFAKEKRVLCEGSASFNGRVVYDNRGLEEFAEVVEGEEPNLRAIWLSCLIPGELVRFFQNLDRNSDKKGVYMKQVLDFPEILPISPRLEIKIARERDAVRIIDTVYISEEQVVKGSAMIAITNKLSF